MKWKPPQNFKLFLIVFSIFISWLDASAISYNRCVQAGWIPYRNEKCLKILNMYETHSASIAACEKQVVFDELVDINIHATLLQIGSRDEEEFIDRLLFSISRYTDNVWLGAVRDGPRAQFRWLDGTSLNNFSVYQKWGSGNPTGDFMKNCVEMRSRDNHNFNFNLALAPSNPESSASTGNNDPSPPNPNSWWTMSSSGSGGGGTSPGPVAGPEPPTPNTFFSKEQGNWYNVACTKHNLVVCQISQLIPDEVVHLQVVKTKKEISKLRAEVNELRRLVGELAANVVTDIRFGNKETTDVWHGSGFPDGGGYVLTGMTNWDEHTCPDSVSRRRFQKFVNGRWYNVY